MRARNIKPGFFLNCELAELDFASRILFIGLWCYADREGRFEWKPKQIKATVFPYDNVNIDKLLCNLMSLHFITRHDTTGYVEHFKKHQNPHPHEAKSSLPEKPESNQCHDMSVTLHGMSCECNADVMIPDVMIPDVMIPDSLIPDSIKTQGAKKPKSPQLSVALIELPEFVIRDSWLGFIEMRQKIRKPPTERAAAMLIKKLTMFHNTGHDVNAILDQSTVNNYQDLYELKNTGAGYLNGNGRTSGSTAQAGRKTGIVEANGAGTDFLS